MHRCQAGGAFGRSSRPLEDRMANATKESVHPTVVASSSAYASPKR